MPHDSYVTESQARQRRRMAVGAVAAVMLAAAALSVLMVYDGARPTDADHAAQQREAASGQRVSATDRNATFR